MENDCQPQVAIQGTAFFLHLWFGFIFAACEVTAGWDSAAGKHSLLVRLCNTSE